jgi:hypothetical protein
MQLLHAQDVGDRADDCCAGGGRRHRSSGGVKQQRGSSPQPTTQSHKLTTADVPTIRVSRCVSTCIVRTNMQRMCTPHTSRPDLDGWSLGLSNDAKACTNCCAVVNQQCVGECRLSAVNSVLPHIGLHPTSFGVLA